MRRWLLWFVLLATPLAAPGKWIEASSDHFVIYADEKPAEIQQFSQQLERFHAAMELLLSRDHKVPSPSNRLTIFVVRSEREVRRLAGDNIKSIYAFYVPRAGASLAIVPTVEAKSGLLDFSMIALLHEYAHHMQLSTASYSYPPWFVEGSAEFFASASFEKDGSLMLGRPAQHRAAELLYAPGMSAEMLLNPATYGLVARDDFGSFYGRSWLLYHFLTFNEARSGQLVRYLDLLRQGKGSIDAGKEAFGDLDVLQKDLDQYLKRSRMSVIRLLPEKLNAGPVALRELSEGEAAVMPVRIRSRRGVSREQAAALLPEAQAIAARYPRDAAVLAALAEAEVDAGHDDPAGKAADDAIAIDPKQLNAYVQKGRALFDKAETAEDKATAYRDALRPFQALNRVENDHPLPLIYYYMSFLARDEKPDALAVKALARAVELAPFDLSLRSMLALQQIHDKQYAQASVNLAPIAYNPHGGEQAGRARQLIDRLKSGEGLDTFDPEDFLNDDKPNEKQGGGKEGAAAPAS